VDVTSTTIEVRRAAGADLPALGRSLAAAFHDDPVLGWIVPDADRRRERFPALFAAFGEAFLLHDETYVTADGAGAALWSPPGVEPIIPAHEEVFIGRLTEILEADTERAGQYPEVADTHHPVEPCFYLQFVGVEPGRQGRGTGSRLLSGVLTRCDEQGTPAYLEATSPDNRRLYERHGFETVDELVLPDGPPIWTMWRESRRT
jgi:GNAT superfamily N-acetyltransferase